MDFFLNVRVDKAIEAPQKAEQEDGLTLVLNEVTNRVAVVTFKLFMCSGPLHGSLPGGNFGSGDWLVHQISFW